jgi:plastocyanin
MFPQVDHLQVRLPPGSTSVAVVLRNLEGERKRGMVNQLMRTLLLGTVTSVLSLCLAACGQIGADSSGSSETKSTTAPTAAPNSTTETSKMAMPARPSPAASKDVPTRSGPNQVVVENFSFQPGTVTVKAGTSVTWVNRDDVPHTVNENDKRFKSGTLDTDGTFTYKFTSPGTYGYFCSLHPRMTGQIIVK